MQTFRISKVQYKISDFISWKKAKSLDLSPSFQRRSVWKKGAKSYLIDTIIRGLPIPIIFIREKRVDIDNLEPQRQVVDGQQRIRTILSFINPSLLDDFNPQRDDFKIKKIHNKDLANLSFKDFPAKIKESILDYEFSVHVLPSNIDDREILQIFARMNSTGVKLNAQELRNAEYFGEFKTTAYSQAFQNLNRWREWGIFSEDSISRMYEVEFTSELIILILKGITTKSQKNIDDIYKKYDDTFLEKEFVVDRLNKTMQIIEDNYGSIISKYMFKQPTIFYVLFVIIYDQAYGIKSKLIKQTPLRISNAVVERTKKIIMTFNEDKLFTILKSGTRRLSTQADRERLFNYFVKLLNAK